jgi:flagellar basal-body rod modification protein FlgD
MQIFSNPIASAAPRAAQAADTSATSGADSSSPSTADTSSATITANDFLQLLVSELQNQDPTADTDPNEYINQLVQVNSLQQLISINQDLTPTSSSGTSGNSGTGGSGDSAAIAADQSSGPVAAQNKKAPGASTGNLSIPTNTGASSRVASAMGTAAQTLAPGSSANPIDSVLSSLKARAHQSHTSTSNPAH